MRYRDIRPKLNERDMRSQAEIRAQADYGGEADDARDQYGNLKRSTSPGMGGNIDIGGVSIPANAYDVGVASMAGNGKYPLTPPNKLIGKNAPTNKASVNDKTYSDLGGVQSNTPGTLRVRPADGNVANTQQGGQLVTQRGTNVANTQQGGQLVTQRGTNVANTQQGGNQSVTKPGSNVTTKPELQTINGPLQIGGPKALNGPKDKNDPNVIDVQARVVPDKKQIGMNQRRDAGDTRPDYAQNYFNPPPDPLKISDKVIAGVAAPAVVGAGLYGMAQGTKISKPDTKDQNPNTTDQTKAKTVGPGSGRGSGQGVFMQGGATAAQLKAQDKINKDSQPALTRSLAPANTTPASTTPTFQGSDAAQRLAAANNIADPKKLKIGQELDLGGGNKHIVKAGDTLNKIAANSSSAVPPKDAVVQPAPTAPATTFSQDVAAKKAANMAPITPGKPAFDVPNPIDDLSNITKNAGIIPKTSTVSTTPSAEPPAPEPQAPAPAPASEPPVANNTRSLGGGGGTNADRALGKEFTDNTTARMKTLAGIKDPEPETKSNISSADIDTANDSDDPIGHLNSTQGFTSTEPAATKVVPPSSSVSTTTLEPAASPPPEAAAPPPAAAAPVIKSEPAPPVIKSEPAAPPPVIKSEPAAPPPVSKNADDFLSKQQTDVPGQNLTINGQKVTADEWNKSNAADLANRSDSEKELDAFGASAKANIKPVPTKESLQSANTINTPRYSFLRGL